MTKSRALVALTSLALTASVVTGISPATARPPSAPTVAEPGGSAEGRGPGTARSVDPLEKAKVARAAAAAPVTGRPLEMPTSYPFQPQLRLYRDNPDDAAHTADLLGHPDLAPKLMELMKVSDRISTQVVGQSTEGRDLYLVTLTAPERTEDTTQQTAWRHTIKNDPDAAATDKTLLAQYKTPIWISNNIHGNEWEGTDGAMRYLEHLATAPLSEVGGILRNNRVYFSLSLNPDGRTLATRATALGLDANRDMITNTTPETRSFIRTAQALQPIYAADFHGYTNVLQLEPCGPPHGSNYEYDLYIPHNYALSLAVEERVVAAAIPGNTYYNVETGEVVPENTGPTTAHVKIPYRDTPDGWDDFPPIFTAQYAAYFGAASATVELPLTRGAPPRQTPERATVNVAVAEETMAGIVDYLDDSANAREMLLNQIETFRRGVAGEPKVALTEAGVDAVPGPEEWKPLWDVVDDQEPVTLPRAYVIAKGADQRSASDATRLVRQLLLHEIEVGTLDAPVTVGATTYPAGSWVVDMHQPLRGLANALLDLGEDISPKVPSMYDISAWSWSYLWGATVDKVGLTTDAPLGAVTPIEAPASNAAVPDGPDHLSLELAGVADFQALNALLEDGVAVSMLEDGAAIVGPEGYDEAAAAAEEFDVAFTAATEEDLDALDDEETRGLQDLRIAYVGTQDDRLSLTELGFDDLVQVTAATLETNPALIDGADALWIGSGFNPAAGSVARTKVQTFVDAGGAIVGRTHQAFNAALSFGLLSGTAVAGRGDGNGIVDVDTPAGSLFAPHPQEASFIYPAYWFTGLGAGVEVQQTYGADPLLAGHWRPSEPGDDGSPAPADGPEAAAGQAAVVSAEAASGARTVVFGTSVFFRNHPKGGLSQAATALFWAAPAGAGVPAPGAATVTIAPIARVTYPRAATVRVSTAGAAGPIDGTVELLVGARVLATGTTSGGTASLRVPGLRPGATSVVARFTPSDPAYDVVSGAPATVTVAKARSRTTLKVTRVGESGGNQVAATVTFAVPRLPDVATIVLSDRGRVIRTLRLSAGDEGRRTVRIGLGAGRHVLTATFEGTALIRASSARRTLTLR